MKKNSVSIFCIMISFWLTGCSQTSSLNAACTSGGAFGDQSQCQANGSTCTMNTIQSASGKNTVCWKQNILQPTGTPDSSLYGCDVSPWDIGAWSSCGTGVTTHTRTVKCKSNCNCTSVSKPVESEACPVMLEGGSHSVSECSAQQGELVLVGSKKVCGFLVSDPANVSCPTGWSTFNGTNGNPYTVTAQKIENSMVGCSSYAPVGTAYHTYYLAQKESAVICKTFQCNNYIGSCSTYQTIYSIVKKVACY
jgi:hypothetical protein